MEYVRDSQRCLWYLFWSLKGVAAFHRYVNLFLCSGDPTNNFSAWSFSLSHYHELLGQSLLCDVRGHSIAAMAKFIDFSRGVIIPERRVHSSTTFDTSILNSLVCLTTSATFSRYASLCHGELLWRTTLGFLWLHREIIQMLSYNPHYKCVFKLGVRNLWPSRCYFTETPTIPAMLPGSAGSCMQTTFWRQRVPHPCFRL